MLQATNAQMKLRIPTSVVNVIKQSSTMDNVRGASTWASRNDGRGHSSNIMNSLVQGRKAEWYVWSTLSKNSNIKNLSQPNFDRDQRASADMFFEDSAGKKWKVEVKSCDVGKRNRNGYQFQVRRNTRRGLRVVDPFIRSNGQNGGDTLFYCVVVSGNDCWADTIFGTPRKDLVCSDPNRKDLKGLKFAIHPRFNNPDKNIIF